MEEFLAIVGFSAGAALAVKIGKSLSRGLRSAAVDAVRTGMKTAHRLQRARNGLSQLVAEARGEGQKWERR
jgi:hypothetical protein